MLWHHRMYVSSRELTPGADDVPVCLMYFVQSAGRAGVNPPPPSLSLSESGLARTGPTTDPRHHIAPNRIIRGPSISFRKIFPFFLCLRRGQRHNGGRYFLVFPFRLYVP